MSEPTTTVPDDNDPAVHFTETLESADPADCPLARLLRLQTGAKRVLVDAWDVTVDGGWFEGPAVLTAFTGMFDEGCFPHLIDRPALESAS